MVYIGIDPGVSGGIAAIWPDGSIIQATKMPATERDVLDVLQPLMFKDASVYAAIERVSASPQMGVVSAFTFGRGFGALLMALTATRTPFCLVSPVKWQTALQCRTGGDKNVSKRRAQQLWPRATITHAIADALLIAEWCRHTQSASPRESDQQRKTTA